MGRRFVAAKIALASLAACTQAFAAEPPPMWAWGVATQAPVPIYSTTAPPPIAEPPAPKLDSTRQLSIAGSKFRFTAAQISNRHAPADWYPEDHPPMPGLVAKGREDAKSPVWACAFCHMPNGKGRPENAGLAGLSYEYIVQQLYDFKNDLRESSDKRKVETQLMAGFAKAMKRNVPNNFWTMTTWNHRLYDNVQSKALYDGYVARTGDKVPPGWLYNGASPMHIFAQAIAATGTIEPAKLIDALEGGLAINSPKGALRFRREDHQVLADVCAMKFDPADTEQGFEVADVARMEGAKLLEPAAPGVAFKA